MFLSISDLSPNAPTLDITDKANLTYILKFGLLLSVAQYIHSCLIFNDIHIDDFATVLDIKLNLWAVNCLESYKFSLKFVIYIMLEVFYKEFYK